MMVSLRVLSVFTAAISLALLTPLQVCAIDVPIAAIINALFARPFGIAFDADGTLLVANSAAPYNLMRVFPSNGTIASFVRLSDGASGIAVDQYSAGDVYVALFNTNTLVRYNRAFQLLSTWPISLPTAVVVDSQYVYVSRYNAGVSVYMRSGSLVRTVPFLFNSMQGITIDSAGLMFIATERAIVKFASNGTVLGNLTVTPIPADYLVGMVVDAAGVVYSTDYYNARLIQWFNNGTVSYIYTMSPTMLFPLGLAIQPSTGNIYTTSASTIFVFAPKNTGGIIPPPPVSCSTGASAGGYDLSKLSINGADLQGVDVRKDHLYFWSACGTVQDAYCLQYAPGSSVCGLSIPITSGVVVARSSSPIVWSFLPPPINTSSISGVSGTMMDGALCGQYRLPSQLIILLICAQTQDATFVMDDSAVSSSATVCTYVLTMHTPLVCAQQQQQLSDDSMIIAKHHKSIITNRHGYSHRAINDAH